MTQKEQQWQRSRNVLTRIFITGRLVLDTPTHFGNGDTEGMTDIGLLRDPVDGKRPLLTGASIAGALRNYVREYELGYGQDTQKDGSSVAEKLFGYVHEGDAASIESWLMVDDALGNLPEVNPIEIRDGVAIDHKTRTALIDEKGKGFKYDTELLSAGTTFRLSFEVWLTEKNQDLLLWLAAGLRGLEQGEIHMGLRKRRGFGRCHVSGWQVHKYEMNDAGEMLGWLNHTIPNELDAESAYQPDIAALLGVAIDTRHSGEAFTVDADFHLTHSILIRSDSGDSAGANMVHLRNAADQPILSGTSLAGVIRGRAYRIANTLKGESAAAKLIDNMFGRRIKKSSDDPSGSHLIVEETPIKNGIADQVQSRVKIDRFTGGAYPQALFSQQPLFARTAEPTSVKVKLALRKTPANKESFDACVGLLLLVLKDLWTEDLPLGGESSVGRGRLRGHTVTLRLGEEEWVIVEENGRLSIPENSQKLETFVEALHQWEAKS